MLERWSEYIKELYDDERPNVKIIDRNFDGPSLLMEEVGYAMKKMKTGKATGPDMISIEMIEPLEEMGIEAVTHLLNEMYKTGEMPKDMLKSIFIAIPKKEGTIDCESHRTISLMSLITKILLRVLLIRARNKIKREISEEQFGFQEGQGTINAIFTVRNLVERCLEKRKDIHICFIDYSKAFDRVQHSKIMDTLQELEIDGNDLRIIRNLYWQQTAAIKIENETSIYQPIKRGVRQGCVMSPDLFSIYTEKIMKYIKDMPGIRFNGHVINNLRYADDTALLATNKKDLQNLLGVVVRESEKRGLNLKAKKTETMVITKRKDNPNCQLTVKGVLINQTNKVKYLGSIVTADGKSIEDVNNRIGQAKSAFKDMNNIFTSNSMSIHLKKRLLQCYVEPILLYGCETWNMNEETKKRLESAEMWFLRRMMKVAWTERKTNETILKEAETERRLLSVILERQARFFGHVMRRDGLEKLVTTGMVDGKRSVGRQRIKAIDNIRKWIGTNSNTEMIRATDDRRNWRGMIAHASKHGTS